jgi:hypothetical protein
MKKENIKRKYTLIHNGTPDYLSFRIIKENNNIYIKYLNFYISLNKINDILFNLSPKLKIKNKECFYRIINCFYNRHKTNINVYYKDEVKDFLSLNKLI